MKFTPYILFFILIAACSTKPRFLNKEVCFLLYDLEKKTFEEIINQDRCEMRFPAASTFKIPLAVMSFDAGLLKDENHLLKWDGTKKFLPAWEKDHTATSWMRESVVWYSQELTPQLGRSKIEYYLKTFMYGNADMSGGIKTAWLTPSDFTEDAMRNSLKISGMEQVFFLEKLWRGELKASSASQEMTQKLLGTEVSPNGSELSGKTGSGFIGDKFDLRIGWYVGYLKAKNKNYVLVINFTDIEKLKERAFGGAEARETAKKILTEKKLW